MSAVVATESSAGPAGLVRQPPRLIFQVGTAYQDNARPNHAAPAWLSLPELRVENIHDGDGAQPGTCEVLVPFSVARHFSESGFWHIPPVPSADYEGRNGYAFYIAGPGYASNKSVGPFKLVRVISESKVLTGGNAGKYGRADLVTGDYPWVDDPGNSKKVSRVEFVGNVIAWTWDLGRECVVLHCQDFRWRLARMAVCGIAYLYGTSADEAPTLTAIHEALPIFNREGRPDRYVHIGPSGVEVEYWAFGPQGLNTQDGETPRVAGSPFCKWFTVGHAVRYLRQVFSDTSGCGTTIGLLCYDGPEDEDVFLEWPDCLPGSYPGLFEAADPGDEEESPLPMQAKEMNLAGGTLGQALDALMARAAQSVGGTYGVHSWRLVPVQGDAALMRLEIFNSAAPSAPSVDLHLPEPGESVAAMPKREIIGGALNMDCSAYRNRIFAVGRKRLIQASFCTIPDENGRRTLAPAWTAAEQLAFRAADPDDRKGLYPNVYLCWGIPRNLDYAAAFFHWGVLPGTAGIGDGKFLPLERRELGPRLNQRRRKVNDQEDVPLRLPVQVWRSKDGGTTWERLPDGVAVDLNLDGPIVRLAPIVRPDDEGDSGSTFPDGTELPWTYDPAGAAYEPPYDLLITMTVEADDRLNVLDDAPAAEYPLEELHEAGGEYGYESISKARVVELDGNAGGVETYYGGETPLAVTDDEDRLAAVVRRKAATLGEHRISGSITLAGFRRDIQVGAVVRMIKTSLGDIGTRGPYHVRAVVREIDFAFGSIWETVLTVEGLPR